LRSEELYKKWRNEFSALEEIEAEMDNVLENAERRGKVKKNIFRELAFKINIARGNVRKAWDDYKAAQDRELAELEMDESCDDLSEFD